MKRLLTVALLGAAFCGSAMAGTLSAGLERMIAETKDGENISVLLAMKTQADIARLDAELHESRAPLAQRHKVVIDMLRETAKESQASLLEELQVLADEGKIEGYTPYWILNGVIVSAPEGIIRDLAAREDVDLAEPNLRVSLIEPVSESAPAGRSDIGITPGLEAIQADRVWYELGIDGTGVLVANMDTGVDGSHEAITSRWRGNHAPVSECWLDVAGQGYSTPGDGDGHGSHVMGTICGLAPNDSIGVAPGAEWIASNPIMMSSGSSFDNAVITSLQWFADPDEDSGTIDDVPDVVQNSWGVNENFSGYYDCDTRWWTAIDNCEAAGVVLTWSAGNEGSSSQTLRSPADRATSATNCFSVGSCTTDGNTISSFSSRGPSGCGGAYAVKPEVTAPGSDIYSIDAYGDYTLLSGTSMAGPHVAGVVALMRAAAPDADVTTVKQILMDTAVDRGSAGEDNDWGYGLVDAFAAVQQIMDGYGIVEGTVSSTAGGTISGASVSNTGGSQVTTTDGSGEYSMYLPADTYTLSYEAFGFVTQTDVVSVPEDGSVTNNISLSPAPSALLSGTVVDTDGLALSGVAISVLDTPLTPVYTNAYGQYSISMPTGAQYTVQAALAGYSTQESTLQFNAASTLNFVMPIRLYDDFETGFLSFPWEFSGDANWVIDDEESYSGSQSARSGDIDDYGVSTMSLALEVSAGSMVDFYYKVSSESNYDFLRFYIDGELQDEWSGTVDWSYAEYAIDAGSHTLSWAYEKDLSLSSGSDCAWVDMVRMPSTGNPTFPEIHVTPEEIALTMEPNTTAQRSLIIANTGENDLQWSASVAIDNPALVTQTELKLAKGEADPREARPVRDSGGPDFYGYYWTDSNEAEGPSYAWEDISIVGSALGLLDDSYSDALALGFDFDFYGNTFSTVRVVSNGFLSFTDLSTDWSNDDIPTTSEPNNLVAVCWDDLSPNISGEVYYYQDSGRFIVQWDNVPHYNSGELFTFQVILNADNSMLFQYHTIGLDNSATVGLENATGENGMRILHNTAGYLQAELAIRIEKEPEVEPWFSISPSSGTVGIGNSQTMLVDFNSADLSEGVYTGSITLASNDPTNTSVTVPVTLTVGSLALEAPVSVIQNASGLVSLEWSAVAGATSYRVEVADVYGGSWSTLVTTSSLSYSLGNVAADQLKLYRVIALN